MSAQVGHLGQVGQVGQAGQTGQLVDGTAAAAAMTSFSRARGSAWGGWAVMSAAITGLALMVAGAGAGAAANGFSNRSRMCGVAISRPIPTSSSSKNDSSSRLIVA
ncbi:hypothetical protein EBZ80_17950 [bacterium]|nr:hypothetical protein [bacterium]